MYSLLNFPENLKVLEQGFSTETGQKEYILILLNQLMKTANIDKQELIQSMSLTEVEAAILFDSDSRLSQNLIKKVYKFLEDRALS